MSKIVKLDIPRIEFRTSSTQIENCATRQNAFINAIIMFIFVNYSLLDKPIALMNDIGRPFNS